MCCPALPVQQETPLFVLGSLFSAVQGAEGQERGGEEAEQGIE